MIFIINICGYLSLFLQLKESNIEEVVKQTSEAEVSAKVFLEELLSDVCRSIDKQMSENIQSAKESDVEGKSLKIQSTD